MELDRTRASRVYGSSPAAWFQDGQYFTGTGEPISFDEAGQPNPMDATPEVITPADVTPEPSTYTVVETPTVPVYDAVTEKPVERETRDKNWGNDRYLKLKALKTTVIAAAVMRAGGIPKTGLGGKKANIQWLLENVKD